MSGLQLGRQIASNHHRVSVVFISAHNEPQVRHEAAQAGAIAFLSKPFDEVELLTAVHTGLRLAKRRNLVPSLLVSLLRRCGESELSRLVRLFREKP
jgi:FixJ family two-component response regulator